MEQQMNSRFCHTFRGAAGDVASCEYPVDFQKVFGKKNLSEALHAVNQMEQQKVYISTSILYSLLQGCIDKQDIAIGRKVFVLIMRSGYESNAFLASHLIRMFALCGSLSEAREVFCKLPKPSLFTWNAIISAHSKLGHGEQAVELYHQLKASGLKPDAHIFVSVFKACSSTVALTEGLVIHSYLIESCFDIGVYVGSTLMDMYTKCGNLEDARKVFDSLSTKNVVSWNVMISGLTQCGYIDDALQLFNQMQFKGMQPNQVTFVSILKACSTVAARNQGTLIHAHIIHCAFESNLILSNTLIDMYAKCGCLEDACSVFFKVLKRNVVTWNAMIAGYVLHGYVREALQNFQEMQQEGIEPNAVTFASIVTVYSTVTVLEQGKRIHNLINESGFESNLFVSSTLINMYAKCGSVEDGRAVFDRLPKQNLVTWSAMIAAYAKNAKGQEALHLFQKMQQEGLEPNQVLFVSILKACTSIATLDTGKLIHTQIINSGFESNLLVTSTLIDMYIKCESLENACNVFNRLPERNVVSWSAMIAGHALYGQSLEALQLFNRMQEKGMEPNQVTFVTILKACSAAAALDQGKVIHAYLIESGLESEVQVCNSLLDMYAHCGDFQDACKVLNRLSSPDVVTWNAVIASFTQQYNYLMALQCFKHMQDKGVKPNDVTFVCLLSVCSHIGLVNEGHHHFESMREVHGISPTFEHYNCMVDLLGRAGFLAEAENLLYTMPFLPNIVGWISLLTNCRIYGNLDLGRQCFDYIIDIDSRNATGFVHMSNIYNCGGMREYADKVEEYRQSANAWKKPGKAVIEVDNKFHDFLVGGKDHSEIDSIYAKLSNLNLHMKEAGYMPCLDFVLCQC